MSPGIAEERRVKKVTHPSSSECEYLVGDDSCRAVKESDLGGLRAEKCHNENKDKCCYQCDLRKTCDISCDLLENTGGSENKLTNMQRPLYVTSPNFNVELECGNCIHYLKPRCPRGYEHDTELWRRQDPCDIFKPIRKSKRQR